MGFFHIQWIILNTQHNLFQLKQPLHRVSASWTKPLINASSTLIFLEFNVSQDLLINC